MSDANPLAKLRGFQLILLLPIVAGYIYNSAADTNTLMPLLLGIIVVASLILSFATNVPDSRVAYAVAGMYVCGLVAGAVVACFMLDRLFNGSGGSFQVYYLLGYGAALLPAVTMMVLESHGPTTVSNN